MRISSAGIVKGYIQKPYGKYGTQVNSEGIPTYSLPLKIEDPPAGAKTFALILEDKDAIPVCGFTWIHWIAANIIRTELSENESLHATDFVQGSTSFQSASNGSPVIGYGGMSPPNAPHTYELYVFALDTVLDLKPGFYMNELHWKMQGHILSTATLKGIYNN